MTLRTIPAGAVLVAAFFAIVILVRTTLPLIDGDVWWHLRAGESVLREGAVRVVDSWTIAGQGMPWTSQDWLTNVAMATIFGAGGRWGATLLSLAFGALVILAFALLWDGIRRRHPHGTWAGRILLLTAGLIVAAPVLGVRAQTVDLTMSSVTIWLLWGYLVDGRRRWLIGLPIATIAWANLHAGWPLLFALGGTVVVGEAADRLLGRSIEGRGPLAWIRIRDLILSLAVCVPALLLNPNGATLLAYPLETASIEAHREFIFEWSRPDLTSFPGQALFAFLLLIVVPTLVVGRRRLRTVDAVWLIGLTILALGAIRFVLVIGPVGAAIAAVSLSPALGTLRSLRQIGAVLGSLQRAPRSPRLATLNIVLTAAVSLTGVAVAMARSAPGEQAAAIAEAMPTQATAWLGSADPDARIFNVYAWGGFIGRELPAALVYIDGRSDIYGDAPIREYARAITLETDPADLLERSEIDAVIFWPTSALADWLDAQPTWVRTYEDAQAAVWVRAPGP